MADKELFNAWFDDQDNDTKFQNMIVNAIGGDAGGDAGGDVGDAGGEVRRGPWDAFLLEQARGWLNAESPEEKFIRRICISNVLRFENEGERDLEGDPEKRQREEAHNEQDVREWKRLDNRWILVDPQEGGQDHDGQDRGQDDDGASFSVSFNGRTGAKRPKITGVFTKSDGLIRLRLDDSENPEFWAEALIDFSVLKDFCQ